MVSTSIIKSASNSRRQRCENHNSSLNVRRRRKADSGDHALRALRKTPNVIHPYLPFLFCTFFCARAFAFLSIPRIGSLSRPTALKPRVSLTQWPSTLLLPNHGLDSFALRAKTTDGDSSEEKEWQAILAAFHMYKAAYGDLKVPLRFVVPSLAPWPEKAWGMKLGQKVTAIRSTGKYVTDERRRKVLDEMGFVWRLRAASSTRDKGVQRLSFDQIYDALVTYREHIHKGDQPLDIPNNFVVPNCDPWPQNVRGLPLGKMVPAVQSKSFLSVNPGAKEKLRALGLPLGGTVAANDARFQLVYVALKRYKEVYGELHVPQPFIVPEGAKEWPESTWGLRLGARVNAIRSQGTFVNGHPERRKLLDDLGFIWVPTNSQNGSRRGRRRREDKEEAEAKGRDEAPTEGYANSLETDNSLESLFGDSFDFGDEDSLDDLDAPQWGLDGANIDDVARMAEANSPSAENYKPPKNLAETLAEVAEQAAALGVIKKIGEDRRIVKGKREREFPWFNDDFGDEFVFDDVVEALTVYKSIYGGFSNLKDDTFVIPSRLDEFSDIGSSSMGALGYDDASVRGATALANFEARRRAVRESSSVHDKTGNEDRREARLGSEVSPNDWPDHLGGMALGNIVSRIRDGSLEVKHRPERKKRLDDLDFDWGDPVRFIDVPFEKALCAMCAYYLVRGDLLVTRDFVMPDEDPWPQALAGYEIGEAVHRIRELQNYFEAYHIDKVRVLRMVEFFWIPEMALPLDHWLKPEDITPELELLRRYGHPDMKLPFNTMPLSLTEKILADGPFFETDDPWLLFRKNHNWDYVKDIWYQLGRRDNAFVLRENGFPQMAAEHEAKYGPGLFTRMNETLALLRNGFGGLSDDERLTLLDKVEFFRQEMEGCKDLGRDASVKIIAELDEHINNLAQSLNGVIVERKNGSKNNVTEGFDIEGRIDTEYTIDNGDVLYAGSRYDSSKEPIDEEDENGSEFLDILSEEYGLR